MDSSDAKHPTLTIGEFYTRHSELLQMKLLGTSVGFDRRIREPTINRPGLALSGFFSYFAEKRIQVLGSAELSYLKSLPDAEARARCRSICERPIPCLVVSRSAKPLAPLLEEAEAAGVAVYVVMALVLLWRPHGLFGRP